MKGLLHAKLFQKDKMYGTIVVGSKGQVVIPIQARKDLKIETGDTLVVMGKMGRALGLIKAPDLAALINMFLRDLERVGEPKFRQEFKKYAAKILSSLGKG